MSVMYRNTITKKSNDDFSKNLVETQDYFKQKHTVNIIGRDFEEILTTNSLYEEYLDKLLEGFDATETEQLRELATSFKTSCLQESVAGIQPYSSLTMPLMVKL